LPPVCEEHDEGLLMRKLGFFVALPVVGALLGVAPAAAQPTPEVTAFCEAALTADKAVNKLESGGKPKQKDVQALETALSQVESTVPSEIAAPTQAVVAATRNAVQSGRDPFEADPNFEQNFTALQQYRYNSCGYTQLDVTGLEYEFQGLPKTLPAGPVAVRFTDTGAELHELQIFRVKSKDSVKKIIGLSKKEQRKKIEEVGTAFTLQGQTVYDIFDLSKPGRYGAVCHLPVGSTSEEAVEEAEKKKDHPKSHADEGMYATIKVEKA
jgi:hypothetical protein